MKKNNKYSSNKAIKDSAKLSLPERKYCSCVMKVRGNHFKKNVSNVKKTKKKDLINPYGICNKSVLKNKKYSSNKKKRLICSLNYDFNKYPIEYLQAYAIEKDMSILTKSGRPMSKRTLLKNIKDKVKSKN